MALAASPRNPRAVFCLKPLNEEAWAILRDPSNRHLVSGGHSQWYLDIGGIPSIANDNVTLATLGRQGDIHIEAPSAARVQCTFEIKRDSMAVMLYDRSHSKSTQVHGMDTKGVDLVDQDVKLFPLEDGRQRRMICINPSINPVLGMCGPYADQILFQLVWPRNATDVLALRVQQYDLATPVNVAHLARTLDDTETSPETTHITRMHTPALGNAMKIRYQKGGKLGEGTFGVVHRVLNVDTGTVMALKQLKQSAVRSTEHWEQCLREVRVLAKIKHPHIQDLIWSQGWDHAEAEIFLGLKDGALNTLVLGGSYAANNQTLKALAELVFHHMLQALDALASKGIIHRDVKPENIFYVQHAGTYHFQLGDFGLSNDTENAASARAGTKIFMAPEMYSGSSPQTHKVDVWSLFVTMLWTLDVGGFQAGCSSFTAYEDICKAVQELASLDGVAKIRRMAAYHPDERASAAQLLCVCFKGQGLSTPRDKVPPLWP